MSTILLQTYIAAPIEVCFDAARDVGLHLGSAAGTGERVIRGRTTGLFERGEEITWQARHFGVRQRLTVRITELDFPRFFADEMVRGAFKAMRHEHYFAASGTVTLMTDKFMYETPFWVFGEIFDALFLKKHMTDFLMRRNQFLKAVCEQRARGESR
ncbi:MAG: SRPBCC family protein [Turneriella sp.]|nr:SRPBCC family protein [Turneriella sp.]